MSDNDSVKRGDALNALHHKDSSAIFDAKELTAAAELINEYVNKNTPPIAYRSTQVGASLRNIIRLLANDIVEQWAKEHPDEEIEQEEIEAQREYEAAVEYAEYCKQYEPTYNPEDGSM